jgi:hypothetical protein
MGNIRRTLRNVTLIVSVVAGLILTPASPVQADQTDIVGPPGGGSFGTSVTVLPNGNIVVTDPYYDAGPTPDVGAVYLYNGATRALISTLTGSTADDQVGEGGVTVLSNGNYAVSSRYWNNGAAAGAGAVTWGNGDTGASGVVSSTNSLVGSTAGDQVGWRVHPLSNGNYVVRSSDWDNGGEADAGAVTWGDGTSGTSGVVSSTNSLVGSTADDHVGEGGVTPLSNGHYVVGSRDWDDGSTTDVGAATWGDGTSGTCGVVSSANSLVGSTAGDRVGWSVEALSNGHYVVGSRYWDDGAVADVGAVTWGDGTSGTTGVVSSTNSLVGSTATDRVGWHVQALSNGHYVTSSLFWDNGGATDAGAVTWGDGTVGASGVVSSTNSLVGSAANDYVGSLGVVELSNSNYVVYSPEWDDGGTTDVGAVTWGDGTTGVSGVVSSTNSLVGSTAGDEVGWNVVPLSNGHYVVSSPNWDNGAAADAGAATWGNGTSTTVGVVSSTNSLVGSTTGDRVGYGVMPLSNGNYVVGSPNWDNGGAVDAGAVTWADGTSTTVGVVSSANSLVGSTAGDSVGEQDNVAALSNGNYVVGSHRWDNGGVTDAGAVTWGDGTSGTTGVVSSTNSLVGSTAGDWVGYRVTALSNGHYVASSRYWDNGAVVDAGVATWGDGTRGTSGVVSSTNSLVGSTAGDQVGYLNVVPLSNGNYVVRTPDWDNGGAVDAGAVTWGNGDTGTSGAITVENSVCGTTAGGGSSMVWAYDDTNVQLVVGRPADNIVTLFDVSYRVYLPLILRNY